MTTQETTKENINKLIEFRQAIYENGMPARRDAMFDLLDALISEGNVSSFAMLSPPAMEFNIRVKTFTANNPFEFHLNHSGDKGSFL